ncbi:hypothetical protein M011DRAFT_493141 [Sporormia fimetaria CBS 119925]|uniref:Mis12-domain-containing protein n=1 Tax=Sporormia fimetaria CBS 119925 TaxID=1340428 RepID=A0A6A6VHZ8_9PLEO|nr:hypothetical protein M011DRAFT_493141 [Sporormia fimetaria CBS 119925]
MATAKQQENMLLTEHFTWPPISLIDEIINSINECLYRLTTHLETSLASQDPSILGFADRASAEKRTPTVDPATGKAIYPEAALEIEEGILKLETLMENAVDKNFDKLEIWTLRNVFSLGRGKGGEDAELGSWMRLGHYENIPTTPLDPTLTPQTLQTLRRRLQETQTLHAALLAEKTRNEAQLRKLRSLLEHSSQKREPRSSTSPAKPVTGATEAPFAFLTHNPAAQALGIQGLPASSSTTTTTTTANAETPQTAGEKTTIEKPATQQNPLTTHTSFTVSHLPHLRQLLASLRPHLATTALPTQQQSGSSRLEMARERKTYIESQSKRILEKRGVDTKDGVEGAVEGVRGGSGEEVGALEGLLGVLKERGKEEGERMDVG